MPAMVSYPRRPKSGHITCYLNRTYHVLTTDTTWRSCRGGKLSVELLPFLEFVEKEAGGVMKTKAFFVCLGLVLSVAVIQQMTYRKAMAATGVRSSEATAWEYGNASPQNACITQCATIRDNCRTNACTSVGGQSDTAQACRNVPPARVQEFNKSVQACFDQEKKCDAGCPH